MPAKKKRQKRNVITETQCSNCAELIYLTYIPNEKVLCTECYQHKRTHGFFQNYQGRMLNNYEQLNNFSIIEEDLLKSRDDEIASLKYKIRENKIELSELRKKTNEGFIVLLAPQVISPIWTMEEKLLGIIGHREYGKDFKTISEIIGTKTENDVINFYRFYKSKLSLDACIKEYELQHGFIKADTNQLFGSIKSLQRNNLPSFYSTSMPPTNPSSSSSFNRITSVDFSSTYKTNRGRFSSMRTEKTGFFSTTRHIKGPRLSLTSMSRDSEIFSMNSMSTEISKDRKIYSTTSMPKKSVGCFPPILHAGGQRLLSTDMPRNSGIFSSTSMSSKLPKKRKICSRTSMPIKSANIFSPILHIGGQRLSSTDLPRNSGNFSSTSMSSKLPKKHKIYSTTSMPKKSSGISSRILHMDGPSFLSAAMPKDNENLFSTTGPIENVGLASTSVPMKD